VGAPIQRLRPLISHGPFLSFLHDRDPAAEPPEAPERKHPFVRRRELILLGVAAVAWPGALRAQHKAMPVIGMLGTGSAGTWAPWEPPFFEGLRETGYVAGQNVTIEHRWAQGHYNRLPALAAELVSRKVDVIVSTGGSPTALALKGATSTIPIVFRLGSDLVKSGFIASLARPGGNLTGVSLLADELTPKRLELLCELVPQARVIALMVNPNNTNNERNIASVEDFAHAKGIQLPIVKATTAGEIEDAFASLPSLHADALVVSADPFLSNQREQIVALASRHTVTAIYAWREFAAAGGLISYGSSLKAAFRLMGIYTGKILKGANPADMPVQQPTTFELVINLKTARALGLYIPQHLLAEANELIE
jgi:putative ABC transport system substrate-binding protein